MSDTQLPQGWKVFFDKQSQKHYYFNTVTNETQWEKPKLLETTKLPPNWVEKVSNSTGLVYYYNKKTGISTWEFPGPKKESKNGPTCSNIRGLKWKGNSCYLDSTLVALFSNPSSFTNNILTMDLTKNRIAPSQTGLYPCGNTYEEDLRNRQMVQNQLNLIAQSIRGSGNIVEYCFNLRETLKKCPDPENYYDNAMKDAGEFLGYILSLFPVNTAVKRRITYATNDMSYNPPHRSLIKTSDILDKNSSIIQQIDSFSLLSLKNNTSGLSNFIEQKEDTYPEELTSENLFFPENSIDSYKRRITYETLEDAPYVVFSVKRVNAFTDFINTQIIPEPIITLPSEKTFFLSAIVIFEGLHYTCAFVCEDTWYYYNDMNSQNYGIHRIGTYNDMLKINPNPTTNGTQYYYTPVIT